MSKPPGVFSLLATAVTGFGSHLVSLCVTARNRLLDRDDDNVTDGGIFPLRAAEHLDALHAARAGIVGHVENRSHLNHGDVSEVLSSQFSVSAIVTED